MNLRWNAAAAVIVTSAGMMTGSDAFVTKTHSPLTTPLTKPTTQTHHAPRTPSSLLHMGPPSDPSAPLTERFGEGSRKYRRTVYTHDQWRKHRSSDRFFNNLGTLFQSGIYKQVGNEVFLTVSIAVSVCVWNALAGGYQDFSGAMHDPVLAEGWAMKIGMPLEAFTLLSPSLGLLLVFRTNASYKRWDEARKFWGLNINHTRDLNRMVTAWYGQQTDFDGTEFMEEAPGVEELQPKPIDPVERQYLLGQVSLMTWAFVRSMKRHLSPPQEDEEDYVKDIEARLAPEQAEALIGATHRPNRALFDLSVAIEQLPMHFVRKNAINNNLSIFEDTLGGCERLLSSPVPLFYSRHTARFLAAWLLLLPLGLYSQFANSWNHWMMIPATAFISVCLFGIEELATQLEEPFTILPMQGFCDKIGVNCDEIISWAGQGQDEEVAEVKAVESKAVEVNAVGAEAAEVKVEPPKIEPLKEVAATAEEAVRATVEKVSESKKSTLTATPTLLELEDKYQDRIRNLLQQIDNWKTGYYTIKLETTGNLASVAQEAELQLLEATAQMEEDKLQLMMETNASIDKLQSEFDSSMEESRRVISGLRRALRETAGNKYDDVVKAIVGDNYDGVIKADAESFFVARPEAPLSLVEEDIEERGEIELPRDTQQAEIQQIDQAEDKANALVDAQQTENFQQDKQVENETVAEQKIQAQEQLEALAEEAILENDVKVADEADQVNGSELVVGSVTSSEDSRAEKVTVPAPPSAANRSKRRMSLRERLSQIDRDVTEDKPLEVEVEKTEAVRDNGNRGARRALTLRELTEMQGRPRS